MRYSLDLRVYNGSTIQNFKFPTAVGSGIGVPNVQSTFGSNYMLIAGQRPAGDRGTTIVVIECQLRRE